MLPIRSYAFVSSISSSYRLHRRFLLIMDKWINLLFSKRVYSDHGCTMWSRHYTHVRFVPFPADVEVGHVVPESVQRPRTNV